MTRLVIHADDVGMCHGTIASFTELSHLGTITSGSVMVPCPWFTELAAVAVADPTLDVGVHLTLNSEHAHYRWRSVSAQPVSAGLHDADGYLWQRVRDVRNHAHPDAVEEEWRAQIDRALAAGIDVTHLDTHMGSALAPEFVDRYVQLGIDYDLPILITRRLQNYGPNNHLRGAPEQAFDAAVSRAESAGLAIADLVPETDFSRAAGEPHDYPGMLSGLDQDLVYCAFHPCAPGPGEIEVIEPGSCHVRLDEDELFRTAGWRQWLDVQDFVLTTMRELRDEQRRPSSTTGV